MILLVFATIKSISLKLESDEFCQITGSASLLYFSYSSFESLLLTIRTSQHSIAMYSYRGLLSHYLLRGDTLTQVSLYTSHHQGKQFSISSQLFPMEFRVKSHNVIEFCVIPRFFISQGHNDNKVNLQQAVCGLFHTFLPDSNLSRIVGKKLTSTIIHQQTQWFELIIYGGLHGSIIDGKFSLSFLAFNINSTSSRPDLNLTLKNSKDLIRLFSDYPIDWTCDTNCVSDVSKGGFQSPSVFGMQHWKGQWFMQLQRTLISIDYFDNSLLLLKGQALFCVNSVKESVCVQLSGVWRGSVLLLLFVIILI